MIEEKIFQKLKILIIDDELTNIEVLERLLEEEGYSNILGITDPREAIRNFDQIKPDLILLDLLMPVIDGFTVIEEIKKIDSSPITPILILTALSDTDSQMRALELGARDFLGKPLDVPLVLARIRNLLEIRYFHNQILIDKTMLKQKVIERTAELVEANRKLEGFRQQLELDNSYLREEVREVFLQTPIIGESSRLLRVLDQIKLVAKTDANVLIEGETGTGKELVARNIHEQSSRGKRPLIKVNCGAIPGELFEAEFFGHKKGAFTGALADRVGKFQLADKGTLFLDEVSELPLDMQTKMLRVLQDGSFERVGDETVQEVDVRIIVASNCILQENVLNGNFREDLYFRLSVFPIHVPPLRERDQDIELLTNYILENICKKFKFNKPNLSVASLEKIRKYDWPGNIRELQNVVEHAVIISGGKLKEIDLNPSSLTSHKSTVRSPNVITVGEEKENIRNNILSALEKTNGKVYGSNGAAKMLGLHPQTLSYKIKKLGIKKRR